MSAEAPLRIARVMTRLNLGGPSRQALASDPLLAERGHRVRLFTGTPAQGEGDLFDRARERGMDVVRVPGLKRGVAPIADRRARRFLEHAFVELAPDVVHTHASKAGAVGRPAARAVPDAARVHTFHGHVLEGYFAAPVSRALIEHERRLAEETDRVVAVSHATADDLVRLGVTTEDRLTVVPPGADLDALLALPRPRREPGPLRELVGAGADTFLLGMVGRLAEVKRPELGFEVFELLQARHRRLELVFVGDGDQRRAVERRIGALDASLRERVHLVGAMDDTLPAFADLDAVLLTSRTEGLPVALIEAAAAALPAFALDVGGVDEIVAHERTGWVGETPADLAFGLDQLLANPGELLAMGQRARVRVSARHSAEALADRLEALYRSVLEARR